METQVDIAGVECSQLLLAVVGVQSAVVGEALRFPKLFTMVGEEVARRRVLSAVYGCCVGARGRGWRSGPSRSRWSSPSEWGWAAASSAVILEGGGW